MKAIIQFNLPEEEQEYKRCNSATDLCSFIWDFQNYLREQWKYREAPADAYQIYQAFFEILQENNINLEEIYS